MKIPFVFFAISSFFLVNAQENNSRQFNQWSIELNMGQNKPIRPFSQGHYTSNPDKYFNVNGLEHFDLGARYMFTTSFGLKLDFAYDLVQQNSNTSLPFKNEQYRVGLQGVANLGRMLQFESFTKRFGLLAHAGVQINSLNPKSGVNDGHSEQNGGILFGLTPQFRVTNYLAITADFSAVNNLRQHFNWDGSYAAADNNLTGLIYNSTIGLTLYLGKNDKHADWFILTNQEDDEARKRLDKIETLMNDTDKDGVADYLDQENNTPAGVTVDTRGKFIDTNKNGVPDELERKAIDAKEGKDGAIVITKEDAIKTLLEKGYLSIFFDTNKDYPNTGSTSNVYQIIKFLKNYPDATATLVGYADLSGNENKNIELSSRRAKNVFDIIVASGINPSRLKVTSEGVDKSFSTSQTGLSLSRRVSILIK